MTEQPETDIKKLMQSKTVINFFIVFGFGLMLKTQ
jgi:hypothetical protein